MTYDFKQLTVNTKYLSYKLWPVGQYVVGEVHSFKQNAKNPKHRDVIVKVIDSNIKTPSVTLAKGDMFTINGTTSLEKVLGAVEENDIIKVTYKGTETVKTGQWAGAKTNVLDVQVAPNQDKAKFEQPAAENDELI
jgi:hypothetical protein